MESITRREALETAALIGGWLTLGSANVMAQDKSAAPPATAPTGAPGAPEGPYKLPPLKYGFADLEPYIDAATMKLHHDIHHLAYVNGANAALVALDKIRKEGGDTIQRVRTVTQNLSFNLAGHILHEVFWDVMKKSGGGEPARDTDIGRLILRDFGTFEAFKAQFSAAAMQAQGSGWGVLAWEPLSRQLLVTQAEKHENAGVPGAIPLLPLDVWEHAYYLNYQNKRADYIKAFFEVIDWESVDKRLVAAMKGAK
jgi:Fe-Mn family superoxide dismutase